jgi:hypothetical protein
VRWSVYAAAARARRSDYHAAQADFYGWLARFFATEARDRLRRPRPRPDGPDHR